MLFLLGLIAGLVLAVLVMVVVIAMRKPIERIVNQVELATKSSFSGRGFVYEPPDEEEEHVAEVRQGIIDRNRERGSDTHISELS